MTEWGRNLAELTCCGLCCIGASAAYPAPPAPNNVTAPASLLGRAAELLGAKSLRAQSSRLEIHRLEFNRLDLRPPETAFAPAKHEPADSPAFPSMKRSMSLAGAAASDPAARDLPALGTSSMRLMSKPEEIARRVQREGLPLARLWENHSALLHIGLSPKGKPGLWLIQKVR